LEYNRCVKDIAALPDPRLDVRDLRAALALASAGTTARAASLLHLTQPAVSRALLALEEKLGTRLFERTHKGLVATPAGESLVAAAGPLLAELGDLERRLRAPAVPRARLRVVCECYTAYHWLPSALKSLRSALPGLEIVLAVEHTAAPVDALVDGAVDVALVTTSPVPRGALGERALFKDEIVFVVAAGHPLAGKRALTRADLRAYPLVTSPTPDSEARWFMARVFGRTRPRLRLDRFPLTEAILDVTRAGMGIAILSEWIAAPHLGGGALVVKRLAQGPLRRPWRMAWRHEAAPHAARLHDALTATSPRALLAAAE
jgi:LysR family transcriptional regulator, regulator for metE and metH